MSRYWEMNDAIFFGITWVRGRNVWACVLSDITLKDSDVDAALDLYDPKTYVVLRHKSEGIGLE